MIALQGRVGKKICRVFTWQTCSLGSKGRRHSSMFAWKVEDSLNNPDLCIRDKLKFTNAKIPTIASPSDVLVKVHSTSINPLDLRMVYGYGRRVLDLLDLATNHEPRITNDRYPLTLGRDFSGQVVATGPCCGDYKAGDLVFGVVEPQRSGAHAQFVTVPSHSLTKKPTNLSHQQAASIPFVALTAYSALCTFGNLSRNGCEGKRILVLGGSGGVGSFAIQLLKLWSANVVATCSEEKMGWLEDTLFVDQAVCYQDSSKLNSLEGKFDFVLDCGAYDQTFRSHSEIVADSLRFLKPLSKSVYVTLSPPILANTDKYGIFIGSATTALEAAYDTYRGLRDFNSARWAVFLPNKRALDYVARLLEDEAITPQVDSIHSFSSMPSAYEQLQSGKAKGKVVVDVTKLDLDQLALDSNNDKSESVVESPA